MVAGESGGKALWRGCWRLRWGHEDIPGRGIGVGEDDGCNPGSEWRWIGQTRLSSTKELLITVVPGGVDADEDSGAVADDAQNNPEEGCTDVVE